MQRQLKLDLKRFDLEIQMRKESCKDRIKEQEIEMERQLEDT